MCLCVCLPSEYLPDCTSCNMTFNANHLRPSLPAFREYLPFFLRDNPSETCPKGGHAAYGDVSVLLANLMEGRQIWETISQPSHATRAGTTLDMKRV